jgi:hypothetical protein
MIGTMTFVVRYLHSSGEIARSYPMAAEDAAWIAADWVRDGERDVMIENLDTGDVWTPEQFKAGR